MLNAVITTIQEPTPSVHRLVARLAECGSNLIVAGDAKGPKRFAGPADKPWPVEFLSLAEQQASGFALAKRLPVKHYARKNLAYLRAIQVGADCIYETDDDNAPNQAWHIRQEHVIESRVVPQAEHRWINVYRYFSQGNIWPRGLPLDEIRTILPEAMPSKTEKRCPIQQGLVNGSPDVDAIWRLVLDRDFEFEIGASVCLEPGNWCPFNTQSTWWWPVSFPLLYLPSYCSFRMCDIWKSFVAQRCLWELGMGVAFHASEVRQDRNQHDLLRDFEDEVVGYKNNRSIAEALAGVRLEAGAGNVKGNLLLCYEALVQADVLPSDEMDLVNAWLDDLQQLGA